MHDYNFMVGGGASWQKRRVNSKAGIPRALVNFIIRIFLEEPLVRLQSNLLPRTIEARTPTLGRGTPNNGWLIFFGAGGA